MNRSIAVVVLLATLFAGCFGYVRYTGPTPERVEEIRTNPKPILVTLADGRTVKFSDPVVRGDSIVEGYETPLPRAVALADVTGIQDRDFQQWRTAFLAAIPVVLGAVITLLVRIGES